MVERGCAAFLPAQAAGSGSETAQVLGVVGRAQEVAFSQIMGMHIGRGLRHARFKAGLVVTPGLVAAIGEGGGREPVLPGLVRSSRAEKKVPA